MRFDHVKRRPLAQRFNFTFNNQYFLVNACLDSTGYRITTETKMQARVIGAKGINLPAETDSAESECEPNTSFYF